MTVTRGGKRKDGMQTRYFSCTGKSHNRVCKGTTDNSNKINLLKNRISEIKLSQDKLVNMLLNDEFDKDMIALLNEKAKKLSEERQELTEQIEALENEKNEIISVINLSKKWKNAQNRGTQGCL